MSKRTNRQVMIAGKPVDMDKLEEVADVQAMLLPTNWPIAKRDGVRLFLALQDMVALELKRHLAHNFSKIAKTALELGEDGDGARIPISFGFELDLSAPSVAAIGKTKMSFSHKFTTEGKAKSHDLNQGDFFADGEMSMILDPGSLAREMEPEPDTHEAESSDGAEGGETAEQKPKKRKKKGKEAAANDAEE